MGYPCGKIAPLDGPGCQGVQGGYQGPPGNVGMAGTVGPPGASYLSAHDVGPCKLDVMQVQAVLKRFLAGEDNYLAAVIEHFRERFKRSLHPLQFVDVQTLDYHKYRLRRVSIPTVQIDVETGYDREGQICHSSRIYSHCGNTTVQVQFQVETRPFDAAKTVYDTIDRAIGVITAEVFYGHNDRTLRYGPQGWQGFIPQPPAPLSCISAEISLQRLGCFAVLSVWCTVVEATDG